MLVGLEGHVGRALVHEPVAAARHEVAAGSQRAGVADRRRHDGQGRARGDRREVRSGPFEFHRDLTSPVVRAQPDVVGRALPLGIRDRPADIGKEREQR